MKQFKYYFGVWDYVIFAAMLLLSALTGVYFAFRHKIIKRQELMSLKDYLTGNKNMKPFPVAMSLIASYISGVTMLGTPAEIYNYGAQYWLIVFPMALSGLTVATVYVPVFIKLQVCSSYEYLELRFHKILRTIASLFFLLDEIMFLPMLIYVPSLAFSQVSGINVHLIGLIVCAVCVFYTILGGLRAVVYTDTWQTAVMFIGDLVVLVLGVIAVGGIGPIISKSIDGGRLHPMNFSLSMYERYTVLDVTIGGYFLWTSFNSVNQTMVQRYLSLPNYKQTKISIALFTFGCCTFISMCCFAGILVYSTYSECDPLRAKRIDSSDQLLPLFVVETAKDAQGIAGIFIAGVFGAALSSLSVVLNSSSVVLLEDFCTGLCNIQLTETMARIISKIIVLVLGILACILVFVVERMGGVFEVATTLSAISAGTMCGLFSLGMLFPWANTKGAIAGSISGYIVSSLIAFGSRITAYMGLVAPPKLPLSVKGCYAGYGINETLPEEVFPDDSGVFPLFKLPFLWVTPIGVATVLIVGLITSFLTGKTDPKTLDPELISPVCQWLMPEESHHYEGTAVKRVENHRLLDSFTPSIEQSERASISEFDRKRF